MEGQLEPLPSNTCFGGPRRQHAFISLGGPERLVSCEMKIPGKPLYFRRVSVTPEGNVNLLNGPYNHRGFVPTYAAQLSSPLAFTSANAPRQLSFALQFAF